MNNELELFEYYVLQLFNQETIEYDQIIKYLTMGWNLYPNDLHFDTEKYISIGWYVYNYLIK